MSSSPALAVHEISSAYQRGSHKREELLAIARKVKPDLDELATHEPVDPYLLSRVEENPAKRETLGAKSPSIYLSRNPSCAACIRSKRSSHTST